MTDAHRPVTDARPSTPDSVAAAVDMALEKLSADRFATADAFGAALTDSTFTGRRQAAASAPPGNRPALIAGAAVVAIALFLVGRATAPRDPGTDSFIARFSIPTPEGNILGNTVNGYVAISRDGNRVAYVAERGGTDDGMFVRDLGSLSSTLVLRGTDGGSPVFSPDGEWLRHIGSHCWHFIYRTDAAIVQ